MRAGSGPDSATPSAGARGSDSVITRFGPPASAIAASPRAGSRYGASETSMALASRPDLRRSVVARLSELDGQRPIAPTTGGWRAHNEVSGNGVCYQGELMIGAILLGLFCGVIARMLVPGDVFRHMSGPRSWLVSLGLGLLGAVVGYLIFTVGLGIGDTDIFDWGGLLSALIGTVIVLLIAGWVLRRAHKHRPSPL
jgi:uncharacterized membrane protein YeaQ/YmgE (transglycosylase-associated protein family)